MDLVEAEALEFLATNDSQPAFPETINRFVSKTKTCRVKEFQRSPVTMNSAQVLT